MSDSILSLRKFGVAFGERIILSNITVDIPDRGAVVLIGPAGTGKSTLLRTLAGLNSVVPSLRMWGEACYMGAPIDEYNCPVLVAQKARLMISTVLENVLVGLPERNKLTQLQQKDLVERLLDGAGLGHLANRLSASAVDLSLGEQRHLAILRTLVSGPKLLCIDEPTTGLDDAASEVLLNYIKAEAERRTIITVVHNQKHAKALDGQTLLIAGGWVQEMRPTREFFEDPRSDAAKDFVRTGSCCVPSPDVKPEELDETVAAPSPPPPEAKLSYVSDSFGPRGFLWLKKGVLAGTPRPGVVTEVEYDLKALQRVGVTVLISLTSTPVDPELLPEYGIKGIWSPIKDMDAPEVDTAKELCQRISELIEEGEVIAVHCRAGLGRTGTILAAHLIWEGKNALEALEATRRVEPRWVQSEVQAAFLEEFANSVTESSVTV